MKEINEHLLKGLIKVVGLRSGSDEAYFYCKDGYVIKMYHAQDCCESVSIESVDSEINHNDIYTDCNMCFMTESTYSKEESDDDSNTWTFYNVKTNKGYDTIRWHGESNGYYSESVDFKILRPKNNKSEEKKENNYPKILTLNQTNQIKIGGHFYFGEYNDYSIEWIKVADDRAFAACVLENMAFGDTNDYDSSDIRKWCNELCEACGIDKDTIYIPSFQKEISKWFKTDKERKCDYSIEVKKRGIDDGIPYYWTNDKNPASLWYAHVGSVLTSGAFHYNSTYYSSIGARPALKLS